MLIARSKSKSHYADARVGLGVKGYAAVVPW
jgi:hypothetical protein